MTQRTSRRRLIAALRVPPDDERLLAAVQPYLPDADSASELAYRLWRRGLELTLAELAGLGVALPPGLTDDYLATASAQRLLVLLPLLRRTGKLALLGLEQPEAATTSLVSPAVPPESTIDASAAVIIATMGGGDFL